MNRPPSTLILFIDDDPEDYEMFCEALTSINPASRCIHMPDGAAGLRYLQNAAQLPDYIFLDIHMPAMGGLECLTKIKQDERLKNVPVIIYTSDSDPQWNNEKRYRDLGAVHFISKGSSLQEIMASIRPFLR